MIRFAVEADISRLVEMGRNFHASSIYADRVPFSEESLSSSLASFLKSDSAVILVAEKDGGVSGVIGGVIGVNYLSGLLAASELFWWVEPDARGIGMPLLTAYEDEVSRRGARHSGMICPHGAGYVEKIYSKRGYAPLEGVFYKEMQ